MTFLRRTRDAPTANHVKPRTCQTLGLDEEGGEGAVKETVSISRRGLGYSPKMF